jgi:hypothetical protein
MPLTSLASILLHEMPADVLYPASACDTHNNVHSAQPLSSKNPQMLKKFLIINLQLLAASRKTRQP